MIEDKKVEDAVLWIRDTATAAAKARSERHYLEEFRKAKKAILMAQNDAKTVGEREMYAYAHPEYLQLLEGYKQAVESDEKYRWQLVSCENLIEVWRTQNANQRALGKIV